MWYILRLVGLLAGGWFGLYCCSLGVGLRDSWLCCLVLLCWLFVSVSFSC